MNQEYRLSYCKVCQNKKFNPETGLVCGLTNEKPDFMESCDHYLSSETEQRSILSSSVSGLVQQVSRGKRFAHFLIDSIVFYMGFLILGVGLGILSEVLGFDIDGLLYALSEGPISLLLEYGIFIGFYVLFEGLFQQTPGKMITKSIVVDENGEKLSTGKVIIRSLVRLVPFEAFSHFSDSRRSWHDKAGNSYVISKFDHEKIQKLKEEMKDNRLVNA
ncbi:RDD family protein [Roseivirga sp. BDSF3-8]|uniref:RDD family protein n=1 Tax=Roseivirga sp. BDSF3-8 TaxID=3241598 RepID=UPI003531C03D